MCWLYSLYGARVRQPNAEQDKALIQPARYQQPKIFNTWMINCVAAPIVQNPEPKILRPDRSLPHSIRSFNYSDLGTPTLNPKPQKCTPACEPCSFNEPCAQRTYTSKIKAASRFRVCGKRNIFCIRLNRTVRHCQDDLWKPTSPFTCHDIVFVQCVPGRHQYYNQCMYLGRLCPITIALTLCHSYNNCCCNSCCYYYCCC